MPDNQARSLRARIIRAAAAVVAGVALAAAAPVALPGAATDAEAAKRDRVQRGPTVKRVQRALRITADGIAGPQTRRAVRRFQRRKGLVVDGIIGPQTLRALGIRARSPRRGPRALSARLRRIAQCESGGNPRAISPGGRYRGKYQFSRATWRSLGGRGDPAKAPERVQDRMAAKLMRIQGPSAWPSCA